MAVVAAGLATPSTAAAAPAALFPPEAPINETVTPFLDHGDDAARAVLVEPDRQVLMAGTAGGDFGLRRETHGGVQDNAFNVDGWVTTDFGANDGANAVVLEPSGHIVAVGWTGGDVALARYDSVGVLDRAFGTEGRVITDLGAADDAAYDVAVDGAGRFVVAAGNHSTMVVLRYLVNGTPDTTFGQSGQVRLGSDGPARALEITTAAGIVAAGGGGTGGFHIAALQPDGRPDAAFGTGGAVRLPLGAPAMAIGLALLADGRILLAGERSGDVALARVDRSGTLDPSYGTAGVVVTDLGRAERPHGLTVAADGSALVTGDAGTRWGFLASYLSDGALDTRFYQKGWIEEEGPEWWSATLPPAPDVGWIVVGIWAGDFAIERWYALGGRLSGASHDASWVSTRSYGAVRYPDGRWVVLADTSGMIGLVRYHPDGTLDTTFGRKGRVVSDLALEPRTIALQSTGRLIVGGVHRRDLAQVAFRADGSLDTAWGPDAGRAVTDTGTDWFERPFSFHLLADDAIAAVGFDSRGTFLARFRGNGSLDPAFGQGGLVVAASPGAQPHVFPHATALQPDGKILVSGSGFLVWRYNGDGRLDTTFGTGGSFTIAPRTFWVGGQVEAIAVLPDGKFLLGERWYAEGYAGFAIARYNPDGTADPGWPPVHTSFKGLNGYTHVGTGQVRKFVLLPDGRFLAVGNAQVARYLQSGALDLTFGDRGKRILEHTLEVNAAVDYVVEAAMAPDGVITLIGSAERLPPGTGLKIARYAGARPGAPTVQAWGWNGIGGLGTGGTVDRSTPAPITTLPGVVDIAAGVYHSLALRADGSVWAWGWNGVGQLGDGTILDRHTPVRVSGLTDVAEISAGAYHSMALKRDGTVWTWGWNALGQLGDGSTLDRHAPVQLPLIRDVIGIAAGGFHSLAVRDGDLWAWGWNLYGQLGDGTTVDRHSAVPVVQSYATTYQSVAAGTYHSLAVVSRGQVRAWGWNAYGQLGDGTTTDRHVPVYVALPQEGFASLAGGGLHSLARHSDGSVWAWGWNGVGQLGDGTTLDRHSPVRIPGLVVADVAAGIFHSAAASRSGVAVTWGWNAFGQLGTGTTADRLRPTAALTSPPAAVVAAGAFHTMSR